MGGVGGLKIKKGSMVVAGVIIKPKRRSIGRTPVYLSFVASPLLVTLKFVPFTQVVRIV